MLVWNPYGSQFLRLSKILWSHSDLVWIHRPFPVVTLNMESGVVPWSGELTLDNLAWVCCESIGGFAEWHPLWPRNLCRSTKLGSNVNRPEALSFVYCLNEEDTSRETLNVASPYKSQSNLRAPSSTDYGRCPSG